MVSPNQDFELFKNFCARRLNAPAFYADPNNENAKLFYVSLESAEAQFGWTRTARNIDGEVFQLVPGFIDIPTPNALADSFQGVHYIGMHSALFVAINEFAMFCFAQQSFFTDVGDPSMETSPRPWDERVPGLWLLDHTMRGGRVTERHSETLIPRDTVRYDASLFLASLMTRFVWLHELAHCFNGHLAYVHDHDIALRLYEISNEMQALEFSRRNSQLSDAEISTVLKCLEFDADQSAFWASCNIQLGKLETIDGIAKLDRDLRIRLTLFGTYASIWLFDEFQKYLDTKNNISHPEPSLRLQNLFRTAETNILPLEEGLPKLNGFALAQFDVIKDVIPSAYGTEEIISKAKGDEYRKLVTQFDKKSEVIKIELERYQFNTTNI